MPRLKPYTTAQVPWSNILNKQLNITMQQRNYSWGDNELTKFLDDIFEIFKEDKYVEKMGSIINLKYNDKNDIYDGQQRILTTILILKILGFLSPKLEPKITGLLTIETGFDTLSKQQRELKTKYTVNIIPKIYCINPYDMEALINIFNNKIIFLVDFIYNIEDFISVEKEDNCNTFKEESLYICKECSVHLTTKRTFIKHIETLHNYKKHESQSKLYNAFIEIYNYFILKNYTEKELIDLYKFIIEDIDIQLYECTDPVFASRIFDWENNRGTNVEPLDIIKNQIISEIQEDKRLEVYDKWELLKDTKHNIYKKDYGKKIFDVAIQLYTNKINRTINLENLFRNIINHIDTYKELNKFFAIVEHLFKIMAEIANDKYGRLITNTPRICLVWETYMWCFLPIFYTKKSIDTKLIKLMVKWYFRNIGLKNRSFNNLCYSNEFIDITNQILTDNNYNYYKYFEICLDKNQDNSIKKDTYIRGFSEMICKTVNATYLLLFLETNITTDVNLVSFNYTLEHIIPQKNKEILKNPSLMDSIGNLTLIEGKDSVNGHKGNSSLGAKTYVKKINSYKNSSSKISRTLAEDFTLFNEEHITIRCNKLALLLNEYTYYGN